jgi:hypothetical protein
MIKNSKGQLLAMKYVDICPLLGMGLSNQLFTFIGALIWCIQHKIPVIIIGNFLLNINQKYYCSIDKVLCLTAMNDYIQNKYNVYMIDVNNTKYANDKEPLKKHSIKPSLPESSQLINTDMGKDILNHILFAPNLVAVPMNFLNSIVKEKTYENIHVIHLKIEDDAIEHYSNVHKVTKQKFLKLAVNKYIELINKYIPPEDLTIILSGSIDNEVITFMKERKYNYKYLVKQSRYREINAVMDMILGKMCSGTFIGAAGSTFSHILSISYNKDDRVCSHLINMDNIELQST